MKKILFKKTVDQSLLRAGLAIPKKHQNELLASIGVSLGKGEKDTIRVRINGDEYEATLTNINHSEDVTKREDVQIRYSAGSPICQTLNRIFVRSAAYIMQKGVDGKAGAIPDDCKEYIEIFAAGVKTLEFECHPIMKTTKEAFIKYLGGAHDLSGYQRSYKLVFYKSFFEKVSESGDVAAYTTVRAFQQYYIDRKRAGLVPDVNVDPIIDNIETSSPESVYSLILRNPFNAISKHGFISKVSKNGEDYFQLNDALAQELNAEDVKDILDIVNQKLETYFSRIEAVNVTEQKNAWLLTWNPNNWEWEDFDSAVAQTHKGAIYQDMWSCVNTHVKPGDRIYLLVLGLNENNGIIASGYAASKTFESEHWDVNKRAQGLKAKRIKVDFDWIVDYNVGEVLRQDVLKQLFPNQQWSPQGSGIQIQNEYVLGLEEEWKKLAGNDEWWPSLAEYSPGITKEKWLALLNDPVIYTESALKMIAEFYVFGGTATCAQLAEHYQRTYNYYLMTSVHLAERVVKETGCPVIQEEKNAQNAKWWPVLYIGRDASKDEKGSFVWRIRDELYEALTEFGIEKYVTKRGEEELLVKDTITNIKNYIAAKGFSYEDGLIENFYLSLKSKPFVILAGTSGTGKTRLVKLFAEAVGATTSNGRYKMVSVRPDWSDSSDLFGHVDLNGKFIPGAIIDFVKQAEIDSNSPYFLCLDEMNLARVEYYLSDILSVIETRDFVDTTIQSDPLVSDTYYGSDLAAAGRYGTVRIPENLYIVGTVNMDETTFPFSRKVLDRANTIEFSYVDLLPNFDEMPHELPQAMNLSNAFLKTEYLLLGQCANESETVNAYCFELQKINRILQKASAHVGYRVRDEIVFYLLNNKKHNLISENAAMDNELMQKILPRIQGSGASVKSMLCELFKLCAGDYDGYQVQSDNVSDKMKKVLNDEDRKIKYRHSAEKIELMTRRFEEDGFTSYWL